MRTSRLPGRYAGEQYRRGMTEPAAQDSLAAEEIEGEVLRLVRELAAELRPQRVQTLRLTIGSSLHSDIGLDSLGRAELLLRIERRFAVNLPDELLASAETPGDLATAVAGAEGGARGRAASGPSVILPPAAVPRLEAETLTGALDWHCLVHPERTHMLLGEGTGGEEVITYQALADSARAVARGLRRWGLAPGERAAIMLPTGREFFEAFFGILYAGGVPVPIYPPARRSHIEEHLRRQAAILDNAQAVILIAPPQARLLMTFLSAQVVDLRGMETVERLSRDAAETLPAAAGPETMALMQFTSGSTGDPNGVVLSHANLLANIQAMGEAMEVESTDIFVSWLPLYHDMGLIGAWLGSLCLSVPVVVMSPLAFLVRPERWLWAIHHHRATLSGAPNFAFELCLRNISEGAAEGLDLSSLRMVANGAEAVSPDTVRRFTDRFAAHGFRAEAMAPVYGLAESSVGLAFPPPRRGPLVDRIDRHALSVRGEAIPASDPDAPAAEFLACGRPLPGHEIRIVDATGRELGERREGRLQFRGPSSTVGYFRNQAKTAALFDGEWLESGDLAYVAGGDIFITGRSKDIIIRAGRNIYPHEIEAVVGAVEGVRKGCVAVFGRGDSMSGTERLIVLAETREEGGPARERIRARIDEAVAEILDAASDEVVLAPPRTVPKTSSGKIRRASAAELYSAGAIGGSPHAPWIQLARLALSALGHRGRRLWQALIAVAYATYWWTVVVALAPLLYAVVVALPRRRWRWAAMHFGARIVFGLTGIRIRRGGVGMPRGRAVLVANHSSYLDGLALAAVLPNPVAFVAKKELANQVPAAMFLRRLGAVFVERFRPDGGVEDAATMIAAARADEQLLFFPEGTFTRMPGLLAFRLGAFATAAGAGLPVVPITMRGTRSVLRGGQWFARRAAISVEIGPAIAPQGEDFSAAVRLRDAVRAAILAGCGEPDLIEAKTKLS